MNDRVLICHPKIQYFYEREGLSIWVTYEFFFGRNPKCDCDRINKNDVKSFHLDRENLDSFEYFESNYLDQIIWIKLFGSNYLDQIISFLQKNPAFIA